MLNKEKSLHPHQDGKFIAQEIELLEKVDDEVETIKALPIPRLILRDIFKKFGDKGETDKDTDLELVETYCVEPKYTKEELEFLKPKVVSNIANTIFQLSGLNMKDKKKENSKEDN